MEKIIFIACLLGLLVFWFFYCKKYRAKKEAERRKRKAEEKKEAKKWKREAEKRELKEACEKGDIDKIIKLLKKGLDPNQRIEVWRYVRDDVDYSIPPRTLSYTETGTLLDITYNPAARKLLRAYGAKTIREIRAEEEPIEKAKKEADIQKVEAFLASKGKA